MCEWDCPVLMLAELGNLRDFEGCGSTAILAQLADATAWLLRRQDPALAKSLWFTEQALAGAAIAALPALADTPPAPHQFVLAAEATALCAAAVKALLHLGGSSSPSAGGDESSSSSGPHGSSVQIKHLHSLAQLLSVLSSWALSLQEACAAGSWDLGSVPHAAESLVRAAEVLLRLAAELTEPQFEQLLQQMDRRAAAECRLLGGVEYSISMWCSCFWRCLDGAGELLILADNYLARAAGTEPSPGVLCAARHAAASAAKLATAAARLSPVRLESLTATRQPSNKPSLQAGILGALVHALYVGVPQQRPDEEPQSPASQR